LSAAVVKEAMPEWMALQARRARALIDLRAANRACEELRHQLEVASASDLIRRGSLLAVVALNLSACSWFDKPPPPLPPA
jgi:hypothetical protein